MRCLRPRLHAIMNVSSLVVWTCCLAGLSAAPLAQATSSDQRSDVSPASFHWNLGRDGDGVEEGLRVVPYGSLWGNALYASQRNSPGPFTLFIFSPDVQDESAFSIDARRSRLGVNVIGPAISLFDEMESGGKVEVDFIGEFVDSNLARARLRHVYWEARNERRRMLVGQTWDVVSPLLPRTLNFSAGWLAGNIGFRRAQVRLERYGKLSENLAWRLEGSLNEDISPDFPTDPGVRRESSDWPVVQGRAALTLYPQAGARAATIGISGHIGETGFDFLETGPPPLLLSPVDNARFLTWSYNFDLETPLADSVYLRGEFFHGSNLSPFLGGIGQGVCTCTRSPIEAIGGWAELRFEWCSWLNSHFGFGIDDPFDSDLLLGRTQNYFLFTNVIAALTPQLSTGLEVAVWRTQYQDTRVGLVASDELGPQTAGEAVTMDWMLRYDF